MYAHTFQPSSRPSGSRLDLGLAVLAASIGLMQSNTFLLLLELISATDVKCQVPLHYRNTIAEMLIVICTLSL